MNEDAVLLRRYIEESSEEAFTRLVHKYVDLVYAAALRRTGGDPHRAADVAQEVFTALARQARKLARHTALSAWLHTATRNVAINLTMSDQRRQQRQQAALDLNAANANPADAAPAWEQVRSVLDAAIDELPEPDRLAVVLRFLERRAFAEIGAALGVSEDAARVRTERAVDKLRTLLSRRGITSTAAVLGTTVSTYATGSAPAGLASALAAKSFAAAGGLGVFAHLTAFMTTKIVSTAAVSAVVAFGIGSYVSGTRAAAKGSTIAPAVVAQTTDSEAALRRENQRLQADMARLDAELRLLNETHAKLVSQRTAAPAETKRAGVLGEPLYRHEVQRAILNNLRQFAAARDQFRLENNRWPSSIPELVGRTAYIRRMRPLDGEDYTSLALNGSALTVTTAAGETVTYDPDGRTTTKIDTPPVIARAEELARKVEASAGAAREAYRLSNQGKDPKNEQALIPYFATPQQGADFVEFLEAKEAAAKKYR